jgi:NhaP-type Na+/H+ or K+/H+ antiporter
LGGAIAEGILAPTTAMTLAIATVVLFVLRPIFGWLSLLGSPIGHRQRGAIAFLGIKGIGSVYYLAYATAHGTFDAASLATIWAVVVTVIVGSIVTHGLTAPWIMNHLDDRAAPASDTG